MSKKTPKVRASSKDPNADANAGESTRRVVALAMAQRNYAALSGRNDTLQWAGPDTAGQLLGEVRAWLAIWGAHEGGCNEQAAAGMMRRFHDRARHLNIAGIPDRPEAETMTMPQAQGFMVKLEICMGKSNVPAVEYITTKEAVERLGVVETTVTRQCKDGKIPGAIPKDDPSNTTGGWKIPISSVPSRKVAAVASRKAKPVATLTVAALWECTSCQNVISDKARPTHCPKCARDRTFTRSSTQQSAN